MTLSAEPAGGGRRVPRKGRTRERERDRERERPPEELSTAPIVTKRLTKRYETLTAVDALDLEIQAGEIFGLLGQNGAGKTTTILMLLGLTEPTSGSARVVGLDPARHPLEVKRRVGYLPDNVGFYDGMTGRENLRYTARLNGIRGREAETRIGEVLEQVGMSARADSRVDTYSRGMLQRLGIADALVKDPSVLILDEPTTAIDPLGVVEILELLRQLVEDRGLAILLSSHLLAQVQSVCDRVGIFASGRLIGVGTVPELAARFGEESGHLEIGFEGLEAARSDAVRTILVGLEGVEAVAPPDRSRDSFLLDIKPREAVGRVREAVMQVALDERLRLTTVREVVPSLDDIYRRALHVRGLARKAVAA